MSSARGIRGIYETSVSMYVCMTNWGVIVRVWIRKLYYIILYILQKYNYVIHIYHCYIHGRMLTALYGIVWYVVWYSIQYGFLLVWHHYTNSIHCLTQSFPISLYTIRSSLLQQRTLEEMIHRLVCFVAFASGIIIFYIIYNFMLYFLRLIFVRITTVRWKYGVWYCMVWGIVWCGVWFSLVYCMVWCMPSYVSIYIYIYIYIYIPYWNTRFLYRFKMAAGILIREYLIWLVVSILVYYKTSMVVTRRLAYNHVFNITIPGSVEVSRRLDNGNKTAYILLTVAHVFSDKV